MKTFYIVLALLISMSPFFEVRGGILIMSVLSDVDVRLATFLCCLVNILVLPMVVLFFDRANDYFLQWRWYSRLFDKIVVSSQKKIDKHIRKNYEYLGVFMLTALPIPGTGAYTGIFIAWLLGLHKKNYTKVMLCVGTGVVVGGIFVCLAFLGIVNIFGDSFTTFIEAVREFGGATKKVP